ncbi:MAG: hypoxanthine phosphoribosyltransferase [Fibrobacteria bacterium]|nr:hypoxanthine phosphoribosyltransferase [Fibrobacteria bacterium]
MTSPSPLLQARQIQARVAQMARDIDRHYDGEEFVLLPVLKGGMVFAADLLRELRTPCRLEFALSSSYGSGTVPGAEPILSTPPPESIQDRHVLVVDDILDTGRTWTRLKERLLEMEALSVRGCFLLDKPARRESEVRADFFGFQVPDVFVVGYGLDHDERWRNLPFIGSIES